MKADRKNPRNGNVSSTLVINDHERLVDPMKWLKEYRPVGANALSLASDLYRWNDDGSELIEGTKSAARALGDGLHGLKDKAQAMAAMTNLFEPFWNRAWHGFNGISVWDAGKRVNLIDENAGYGLRPILQDSRLAR